VVGVVGAAEHELVIDVKLVVEDGLHINNYSNPDRRARDVLLTGSSLSVERDVTDTLQAFATCHVKSWEGVGVGLGINVRLP